MNNEHKTFRCSKCLLHKKMLLLAYTYGKNRSVCTNCETRILEAANKAKEIGITQ